MRIYIIITYIMQQHKEPSKILHCIFSSLLMHNLGQDLTTHVKHKIPLINRLYKFANCPVFPKKKGTSGEENPNISLCGFRVWGRPLFYTNHHDMQECLIDHMDSYAPSQGVLLSFLLLWKCDRISGCRLCKWLA